MSKKIVDATINSDSNSENAIQNPVSLSDDTREIKTYNKQNLPWSCNALTKRIDKGEAVFDSAVQRTYVWTIQQKSLLIHSLIIGAPIPPMYATKETAETENGNQKTVYSFLDGKQRSNAIHDFISGNYALQDVPPIDFEDGSQADINGLYFDDLSDNMKDNIKNTNLVIYVFEGLSDDQTADIFYRLNNGKSLSAIELSRVKAKSLTAFQEIAKSDLFSNCLSEKAIAKYGAEDIAIKSHIMAYSDEKCTDTKFVRPYVEQTSVSESQISELKSVFEFVNGILESTKDTTDKALKRAAKRVVTRTHLLSMIPLYLEAVRGEKDKELVKKFVFWFFGTAKTSVSLQYNNNATQGSGHEDHIAKRLDAISKEWGNFLKEEKQIKETAKTLLDSESKIKSGNQNSETETEIADPADVENADHIRYYVQRPDGHELIYDRNNSFWSFVTEDDFPSYWESMSPMNRLEDLDSLDLKWEDTTTEGMQMAFKDATILAKHAVNE